MKMGQQKRTQQQSGQYTVAVKSNPNLQGTWEWLHCSDFKRETKGLLVTVQDQVLRTNWTKNQIDKYATQPTCRLCIHENKNTDHVGC